MLTSDAFSWVSTLVRAEAAIVLEPGKEYLVETRLAGFARAAGAADVNAWVGKVRSGGTRTDREAIVEALTTNETSWFRDASPFTAFAEHVLPALAADPARAGSRRLRVWSAACSSGQEAYSLLMATADALPGWTLDVVATDISEQMCQRTRDGRYSQLEVNRGMPAMHLVKHMSRDGAHWRVSDSLRRQVSVRKLNLAAPWAGLGQFDVVFCRNVLIYFDQPTKADILTRMRSVLRPDGWLFLGGAESPLGIAEGWDRTPLGRATAWRPAGAPAAAAGAPSRAGGHLGTAPPRGATGTPSAASFVPAGRL